MSLRQATLLSCFLLVFVSIGAGAQLLSKYFDTPEVATAPESEIGTALHLVPVPIENVPSEPVAPIEEQPGEGRKRKVAIVMASPENLPRVPPTTDRPATPSPMPAPQARPVPPPPPQMPSWVLNAEESK